MLNIKSLTENKELAREEMSMVRGGKKEQHDAAHLYPAFPSYAFSFEDNDMVSASIGQQMLNDIDAAFANIHNDPTQNASINVFA